MPRVTVNKDSLAVTPLPSPMPAPELQQPGPLLDVPLTAQIRLMKHPSNQYIVTHAR